MQQTVWDYPLDKVLHTQSQGTLNSHRNHTDSHSLELSVWLHSGCNVLLVQGSWKGPGHKGAGLVVDGSNSPLDQQLAGLLDTADAGRSHTRGAIVGALGHWEYPLQVASHEVGGHNDRLLLDSAFQTHLSLCRPHEQTFESSHCCRTEFCCASPRPDFWRAVCPRRRSVRSLIRYSTVPVACCQNPAAWLEHAVSSCAARCLATTLR